MKIYTRTGDKGETSLFGGKRVPKDSPRIHAYGSVDELNAVIGMAVSLSDDAKLIDVLRQLQNELFVVGADLATPGDIQKPNTVRVEHSHINRLEREIDIHEQELEPLKYFILPGGTTCASVLHFARTVCRRAERETYELLKVEDINNLVCIYLNRLSDLLFVLARVTNRRSGREDIPWHPREEE